MVDLDRKHLTVCTNKLIQHIHYIYIFLYIECSIYKHIQLFRSLQTTRKSIIIVTSGELHTTERVICNCLEICKIPKSGKEGTAVTWWGVLEKSCLHV